MTNITRPEDEKKTIDDLYKVLENQLKLQQKSFDQIKTALSINASYDLKARANKAELDKEEIKRLKAENVNLEEEKRGYQRNVLYRASSTIRNQKSSGLASVALSILTGGLVNPVIAQTLGLDKILSAGVTQPFKALGNAVHEKNREIKRDSSAVDEVNDKSKTTNVLLEQIATGIKDLSKKDETKEEKKSKSWLSKLLPFILGALGIAFLVKVLTSDKVSNMIKGWFKSGFDSLTKSIKDMVGNWFGGSPKNLLPNTNGSSENSWAFDNFKTKALAHAIDVVLKPIRKHLLPIVKNVVNLSLKATKTLSKLSLKTISTATKLTSKILANSEKIAADLAKTATKDTAKIAVDTAKATGKTGTKVAAKAGTKAGLDIVSTLEKEADDIGKGVLKTIKQIKAKDIVSKIIKPTTKFLGNATKNIGKILGFAIKKIPGLSLIIGGISAAKRAEEGDWGGAGLELLSGILACFPGLGTAISLVLDGILLGKDLSSIKENLGNKLDEVGIGSGPSFFEKFADKTRKAVDAWNKGDKEGLGFIDKARAFYNAYDTSEDQGMVISQDLPFKSEIMNTKDEILQDMLRESLAKQDEYIRNHPDDPYKPPAWDSVPQQVVVNNMNMYGGNGEVYGSGDSVKSALLSAI